MIWLILGVVFFGFMIWAAVRESDAEYAVIGLMGGFFIILIVNGIFATTIDQDRSYESHSLQAIDANGSLVQIDDSDCYYNTGKGIESVIREKCEIVESGRGEIKTTHYTPNLVWTMFTWRDYNRFYVTREQVSYGN